jgi:hypothetical protein
MHDLPAISIYLICPDIFADSSFSMYGVLDHSYLCKRYAMEEAINNLKQLCHPSMMDEPDALVNIKIEFDMRASKKDRYSCQFLSIFS